MIQLLARGYKTFFMLNITGQEISTAEKTKIPTNKEVSCLFIMLINVKMATSVGILAFMSRINFLLS